MVCTQFQNGKEIVLVNLEHIEDIELMQFTGLLDKNGKEIYEGDIVKSNLRMPKQENYVVEWCEKSAEFFVQNKNICERFVEVIGNIYENPELLGVADGLQKKEPTREASNE